MGDSKWKEMAEKNTILKVLVGSQVYGLMRPDGQSDRDEKGVALEPIEAALSLTGEFEQYEYRTATERTGDRHAKSEPGDLDLTIYSLKKFLSLAIKGNPSIIEMLFVRGEGIVSHDARGTQLQDMAPFIVSRQAGKAFLGFMDAQKKRMVGELGQMKVHRPELVELHGYDTKFASHIIRLGYQGIELLETGAISLPMVGKPHDEVMAVKEGKWTLDQVLTAEGELAAQLKDLITDGPIQEFPNVRAVSEYMLQVYLENWKANASYKYFHATRKSLNPILEDDPETVH